MSNRDFAKTWRVLLPRRVPVVEMVRAYPSISTTRLAKET